MNDRIAIAESLDGTIEQDPTGDIPPTDEHAVSMADDAAVWLPDAPEQLP